MDHTGQWRVDVFIDEHDGITEATARIHTRENELTGRGTARCNPKDTDVPEIGDELAVARALTDLAHTLFDATVSDIETVTHRRATVTP